MTARFSLETLKDLSGEQVALFRDNGYLIVEAVLSVAEIETLRERFEPLFTGDFDTGIYPDEWYWREGMSLPDVTRHMANVWKSDTTMAALVTSPILGQAAARLADWPGARLGQDTLWMKTPHCKEIVLHQDSSFIDFLDPPEMVTCWFTLDDTRADGGMIEYVAGSHRWALAELPKDFHTPEGGYQARMRAAAKAAGIADPGVDKLEIPAGTCVFHHGYTWQGSGPNLGDTIRRSVAAHTLSSQTRFQETGAGYIYGRYKRRGDTSIDDNFFPTLWEAVE